MAITNPVSPFPISQWTWDTLSGSPGSGTLVTRLNKSLGKLQRVFEQVRKAVSGPTIRGTIPPLTAATVLSPYTAGVVLVDATGGAFATTLPLSTGPDAAEVLYIVKRINAGGNVPTIALLGSDIFADTGNNTPLNLAAQWSTFGLWCDGAGKYYELFKI